VILARFLVSEVSNSFSYRPVDGDTCNDKIMTTRVELQSSVNMFSLTVGQPISTLITSIGKVTFTVFASELNSISGTDSSARYLFVKNLISISKDELESDQRQVNLNGDQLHVPDTRLCLNLIHFWNSFWLLVWKRFNFWESNNHSETRNIVIPYTTLKQFSA